MTSRERWTIYPLLFLAIGIALRDQFPSSGTRQLGRLEANEIVCDELYVRESMVADIKFDNLLVKRIYTLDNKGRRVLLLDGGSRKVPLLLRGAEELLQINTDTRAVPNGREGEGERDVRSAESAGKEE